MKVLAHHIDVDWMREAFRRTRKDGADGVDGRGAALPKPALCSLSDCELVARLAPLVQAERHAMVELIEHLVEMERRRLYLRLSVPSTSARDGEAPPVPRTR